MKIIRIAGVAAILTVGGFLLYSASDNTSEPKIQAEESTEVKAAQVAQGFDEYKEGTKVWKTVDRADSTIPNEVHSILNYIKDMNVSLQGGNDEKLVQADYEDDSYYQYLQVMTMEEVLKIYNVHGGDIERDVDNMEQLSFIIVEEYHIATAGTSSNGTYNLKAKPTERFEEAVDYMKLLVNDLNVIMNDKGTAAGYTRQLDGDKVDELETFIYTENRIDYN